jgi:hypothetical protein
VGASLYQSIYERCKAKTNEFHIEVSEYTQVYEL